MPSYRIVCIVKPINDNRSEEITHIGYYETAYKPKVMIPVAEAIKRIKENPREFYIRAGDRTVFASVETPENAKPFIKTLPDSVGNDYLLSFG